MSKYKAIIEWLSEYKSSYGWIFFNNNPSEDETLSLNSISSSREEKRFIDGSKEVSLLFAIVLSKKYDTGTNDVNLDAMNENEQLMKWVEEKNKAKEFPNLGDNVTVKEIECLESSPSVLVDNDENLAKYQTQFHIIFREV